MKMKHWIAFYYQIKEIEKCNPSSLLIIGKGEGIIDDYFKNRNVSVTTYDIDKTLKPDVVGDIKNVSKMNKKYDVVVCCEVLEHLCFDDFDLCLKQIKKVAKNHVLISVPYNGIFCRIQFDFPLFHNKNYSLYIPHKKKIMKKSGGHQWEIGYEKKTNIKSIKKIIKRNFNIVNDYRLPNFPYIHIFNLEVKK